MAPTRCWEASVLHMIVRGCLLFWGDCRITYDPVPVWLVAMIGLWWVVGGFIYSNVKPLLVAVAIFFVIGVGLEVYRGAQGPLNQPTFGSLAMMIQLGIVRLARWAVLWCARRWKKGVTGNVEEVRSPLVATPRPSADWEELYSLDDPSIQVGWFNPKDGKVVGLGIASNLVP
jgi:hypothetical protein